METSNARYQIGVDINSNKCEKDKKPAKEKIQIGTMRCLRPDNEVTDIDAASTASQGSKFSDIMKCMFFRKKETTVVEMKPEKASASNKQSLSLDRSERSRRVLKMESMRAAPREREEQPPGRPLTPPATKRFLPSENPTAAFLAYVNPQNKQVRRAYSEAIKSSNTPSENKPIHAREAFVQKHESLRNTNYRANAAIPSSEKKSTNGNENEQENQIVITNNTKSKLTNNDRVTVVPGTAMSANDEIRYHNTDDIHDLHDEIRRIKMSQMEKGPPRRRRREGSISVSGSGTDSEDEDERPKNPEPEPVDQTYNDVRNKSMEEAIDGLYMQTQRKLENIYQNGLGTIETYRPESSVDEPDMTKFERDLFSSEQPKDSGVETESGDNENGDTNISFVKEQRSANTKSKKANVILANPNKESAKQINMTHTQKPNGNAEQNRIDNLLNEVSVWAKDRENWLLGRTELDNKYSESKEKIKLSHKVDFHNDRRTVADLNDDNDEIDRVRASNEQRCNNWVEGKHNTPRCSQRTIDIITSPKIFTPRNIEKHHTEKQNDNNEESSPVKIFSPRNGMKFLSQINDMDKVVVHKEENRASVPSKRTHKGIAVYDYSVNAENEEVRTLFDTKNSEDRKPLSILADKHNEHNKTIINGIVIPTPTFESETEDERSTIRDDLSDLDRKVPYRARSPDSWLSSCGSPTNFLLQRDTPDHDFDDSLGTVSPLTAESFKVRRVAVANAHAVTNSATKQHSQTQDSINRHDGQRIQIPYDPPHLPLPKSMSRNTQLQPIGSGSSFRQNRNNTNTVQRLDSISGINSLTGLPSMVTDGVLKGTRNLKDFELNMKSRPFSEIPLGGAEATNSGNENSRFLGNATKYQGGLQAKIASTEVVDVRPASETLTAKRTDRVGMGHVMATDSNRERNRYAKEIVRTMESKRQQPQKAFSNNDSAIAKPKYNDAAFLPLLLQGGYSYDQHSSQRLKSASGNGIKEDTMVSKSQSDSINIENKTSCQNSSPAYTFGAHTVANASVPASFNESNLRMNAENKPAKLNKSEGTFSSARLNGGYIYDYNTISQKTSNGNSVSGNVSSLSYKNVASAYDSLVPINKTFENTGKSNIDADMFSVSQSNKTTEQTSHGSVATAEKFRKMRDRRNQEMRWLMKDAAETEV